MPSTPSSRIASKNPATRSGSALLNSVQLMLTLKPCAFDSRIAAVAREIASKKRLQHQHERIARSARQVLPHDIGADKCFLKKWNAHPYTLYRIVRFPAGGSAVPTAAQLGGQLEFDFFFDAGQYRNF